MTGPPLWYAWLLLALVGENWRIVANPDFEIYPVHHSMSTAQLTAIRFRIDLSRQSKGVGPGRVCDFSGLPSGPFGGSSPSKGSLSLAPKGCEESSRRQRLEERPR